jgi:hypothetical protein
MIDGPAAAAMVPPTDADAAGAAAKLDFLGAPDLTCEILPVEALRLDSLEPGQLLEKLGHWSSALSDAQPFGGGSLASRAAGRAPMAPSSAAFATAAAPLVGQLMNQKQHGSGAALEALQYTQHQAQALASPFGGPARSSAWATPPGAQPASPRAAQPQPQQRAKPQRGPSLLSKRYHDAMAQGAEQQQQQQLQDHHQQQQQSQQSQQQQQQQQQCAAPPPSRLGAVRQPPRRMVSAPQLLHPRHPQAQHSSASTPSSPTAAAGRAPGCSAFAPSARPCPPSPLQPPQKLVAVWDLDETLIVFNSLISGTFARANPGVDAAEATALGERWRDAILDFCDDHLHFRLVRGAAAGGGGRARW